MSSDRIYLRRAVLLAGAATFALAGCNTVHKHIGEVDPYFGEAVKYNAAAQIINPDPVYPPNGAQPGSNGDKGARAVKRYRTDAVKAVETTQTSTGSSAH
jgi:type IV pilus biogenesis protein CpaD/CtpE